jgi:signal transduction histidine kinase
MSWVPVITVILGSPVSWPLEKAIRWLTYTVEGELLMNQISEASKRISALVADAKQYSQLDRAPFQVTDVHVLLRSTLAMFADRLGKDGAKDGPAIAVVKNFDQSLPEIPCYPGDLNQVWTNIIDNAIAAMRAEGGTLTLRTSREGENMARVEICDTGPGIPEDVRDRIFEPFFTTKPFGEGTGLGLDLAWNIVVKNHRGDLRVESVPGDTRFIVLLPLQMPAADAAPAE